MDYRLDAYLETLDREPEPRTQDEKLDAIAKAIQQTRRQLRAKYSPTTYQHLENLQALYERSL